MVVGVSVSVVVVSSLSVVSLDVTVSSLVGSVSLLSPASSSSTLASGTLLSGSTLASGTPPSGKGSSDVSSDVVEPLLVLVTESPEVVDVSDCGSVVEPVCVDAVSLAALPVEPWSLEAKPPSVGAESERPLVEVLFVLVLYGAEEPFEDEDPELETDASPASLSSGNRSTVPSSPHPVTSPNANTSAMVAEVWIFDAETRLRLTRRRMLGLVEGKLILGFTQVPSERLSPEDLEP